MPSRANIPPAVHGGPAICPANTLLRPHALHAPAFAICVTSARTAAQLVARAEPQACTEAEMDGGRGLIVSPWKGGKVAGLAHNLVVRSWLTHLHSGCYACASQCDLAPLPSAQAMKEISTTVTGGDDLRELCTALEAEIAQASQAFTAQVQRVLAEAEQSARAIGAAAPGQSLRACGLWVEQEKRRKEKQGLPSDRAMPSVDWAEERAQYLATTRAMEAKFAQLTKLRRLLQAKYNAARRKIHAGRY
ncbi:Nsun2 [Symbiodinium natans]|uniref:Nsun2 protein n=1 Tax=Symbiodinium natans TaxID=878477 RepID=A0A812KSF4_9DINO|nr:Nsun2 [Symbiodinium natans]